jgi:hypothetical protein
MVVRSGPVRSVVPSLTDIPLCSATVSVPNILSASGLILGLSDCRGVEWDADGNCRTEFTVPPSRNDSSVSFRGEK